jgi:hypothetical protein
MNQKSITMAAALFAVAMLVGVATSITPLYGDESETETEQTLKQKNVGSGESTNINCGANNLETTVSLDTTCPTVSLLD